MQPGQYSNYPRAPIQEINFGTIKEGWDLILKNWQPFATASLMALLVGLVVYGVGFIPLFPMIMASANPDNQTASTMGQLTLQFMMLPVIILAIALASPFYASMTHMTLKLLSGQSLETNDAFVGFQRLGQIMVAGVIMAIGVSVGSQCCYLPGFFIGGMTMFTYPLMFTRNYGPMDALKESWNILIKHVWMAMLFYLVISLLAGLGVCACFIGVLVTMPLLYVCPALVFRDFNVQPVGMVDAPVTTPGPESGTMLDPEAP
ncbi:MAG: hypothetical protein KIT11_11425 [Fimbriimonadaceae bacterium]|nr:hypothetical protein [Fimbriimonadaceae bacterium]QYK55357.1 MAG: hypothetical protein KF733_10110 [Fimbriimonadaceae bacterium]